MEATLKSRPEVLLVDEEHIDDNAVVIEAAEGLDEATMRTLRSLSRKGCRRIVLVIGTLDESGLMSVIEIGVCAVVRRSEATAPRLAQLIVSAAAGEGVLPPDLLGRLLLQVGRLQRQVLTPMDLHLNGLSDRETRILRLVADGYDTREIAAQLCYSERTVKNVLHDITSRFQLKNRSQAVAYALREGLI
ncbi:MULTISPECIES: response regulator transcription factor [unclassified Streptomyces]|uniref:Response regulator transcription factor n=1 Tax=Streptomyces sp. NBC_00180 TaxID=2903632 RepID=A0AAU1IBA2_9ACTN|nr:response regulator transcription factor [Streptomyces sp. NBC_01017]WSV34832.1 response regulator transcription factor [Streptomyces sp. NBC_01017]